MLAENCDPWKYFQKKRIAHVVYVHPYRVGLSIVTKSVCCEVMRWWVGGVRGQGGVIACLSLGRDNITAITQRPTQLVGEEENCPNSKAADRTI